MKIKIAFLVILVAVVLGCNKDENNIETNINGNFIGTFERSGNISNVEISFNNGAYSGQSDLDRFPALCNGSYLISGSIITFENACVWTADFDWTLILKGNWTYSMNNNELILINDNGDKYTLAQE